jgi:hypothetical protein
MLVLRTRPSFALAATFLVPWFILGGARKPPLKRTGFLEDYSKLEPVNDNTMRYISPELKTYKAFIVDPVEFTVPPKKLFPQDRAEAARYFRSKLIELLRSRQYEVVDDVGVNVARIQLGMTDVATSTWWMKIHPASRMSGAGTGGAACEGEIIDSVTGEQLAAWISTSSGNPIQLSGVFHARGRQERNQQVGFECGPATRRDTKVPAGRAVTVRLLAVNADEPESLRRSHFAARCMSRPRGGIRCMRSASLDYVLAGGRSGRSSQC